MIDAFASSAIKYRSVLETMILLRSRETPALRTPIDGMGLMLLAGQAIFPSHSKQVLGIDLKSE
ncbi:MAG: hypothetical protein J0H09_01115 [Burkholderiales bacterium]|nr:hypothetical protein [Burkholderiales bacterium]